MKLGTVVFATVLCAAAGVFAQQIVYPAKGQTPDQQKKDESECYTWAVQQTGFDPAKPPPAQPSVANDRSTWRIQPVNATVWLNISAGVLKPSVFLGLSFNCLAIALSLACE